MRQHCCTAVKIEWEGSCIFSREWAAITLNRDVELILNPHSVVTDVYYASDVIVPQHVRDETATKCRVFSQYAFRRRCTIAVARFVAPTKNMRDRCDG